MDKTRLRILAIVFVVLFPFILQGQTAITSREKRQLEEKFKALKTFYIDDDGTVVYYEKGTSIDTVVVEPDAVAPVPRVKVKVSVNESGEFEVTSNEDEVEEAKQIAVTAGLLRRPVSTDTIKTQEIEAVVEEAVVEESLPQNTTPEPKRDSKNKSVYPTIEAAKMAVDEKIEELRRQFQQNGKTTRGNSFSEKISGRVDGSLRRNTYRFNEGNDENTADLEDEFNGLPTYYINGERVEKVEADKLKERSILKKEMKRSTKNPNGEIWIETIP